jgi:hypothetical protein
LLQKSSLSRSRQKEEEKKRRKKKKKKKTIAQEMCAPQRYLERENRLEKVG